MTYGRSTTYTDNHIINSEFHKGALMGMKVITKEPKTAFFSLDGKYMTAALPNWRDYV